MTDMTCPYCDSEQEVCHDDGAGYAEDETHQHTCSSCGKSFVFSTYISFSYEASPADCLNTGEHDFKPTVTTPKCATRMRCTMCGEEREPTEAERLEHCIPTYAASLGTRKSERMPL